MTVINGVRILLQVVAVGTDVHAASVLVQLPVSSSRQLQLLSPPRRFCFHLCLSCLFVCLFVSRIAQRLNSQIFVKFCGTVRLNPRTNRLDFGGDPDLDTDRGIFE